MEWLGDEMRGAALQRLFYAYQTTYGSDLTSAFVTKLNSTGTALDYSTYISGSNDGVGLGIVVNGSGVVTVVGTLPNPSDPPALFYANSTGDSVGFVTRLNSSGTAASYNTTIGDGEFTMVYGVALDSSGSAYVVGGTSCGDFATSGEYQTSDTASYGTAFVEKLS